MMGSRPGDFSSVKRSQPPPRKAGGSRPPQAPPASKPIVVPRRDASVLMTAEQLLREPAGPRSEPPRSLSNAALLASLRPPPDYGNGTARRSMEPHLIEGVSWFLERTPWQRALLSSGLGALVGVGIVVTLARLFVPELGSASATAAATAAIAPEARATALAAPATAALLAPAATTTAAPAPVVEAGAGATAPIGATARSDDAAPAATAGRLETEPRAEPPPRKAARKSKAAKRKKARPRARKPASLPARWSELYARDR